MSSALPVRAVPYDAYESPEHLHQPASSHPQQPAAVSRQQQQQPWYDVSDGAVTPPDDASSSSHRGDFAVSAAGAALPPASPTRRRPLGCRLAATICVELLALASLAVGAYFLRVSDLLPLRQLEFSCFDPSLGYRRTTPAGANTTSSSSDMLFGRIPHNAAHVLCFCLPPTIMAVTELMLWSVSRQGWQTSLSVGQQCRLSLSFRRIIRFTGTFVLGFLLTVVSVDVAKLLSSRPRPTFISACRPNWTQCDVDAAKLQLSSMDVCQQTDQFVLLHALKSFPSTHAAIASFSAIYLAIYVHSIMSTGHKAYILRPFLSVLLIFSPIFYCLYRLTLNVNQSIDVAAGFAIGLLLAIYLGMSVLRGFHERLSPGRLYARLERALGLLEFGVDLDDWAGGGKAAPGSAASSSAASHAGGGGEWRCTDSTSARSWHHFLAASTTTALPHPVLVNAHHHHQHQLHHHQQQQQQQQSQKLTD